MRDGNGPLAVVLVLGPTTGGIGRHVCSLAADLAATGHRVRVLGPSATQRRFEFAAASNGVTFDAAETGRLSRLPRSLARIAGAAAATDVVHAHGLRAAVVSAIALRRFSRRSRPPTFVVTLHNAPTGSIAGRAVARFATRRVIAAADATLVVGPGVVSEQDGAVERALIAAPPRVSSHLRVETRKSLGINGSSSLVLAVGRLHPQKGFDILVSAAPMVGSGAVVFAIAGEGPQRRHLERLIAVAGVDVRLLGDRTDIAALLEAADLVVMPSRWEGWPLAAAEALAAGRPLVASDVGGIPDLVGDAAILVPVGDVGALARTIDAVLADDREAMEVRALARAAMLPTTAAVAESVLEVYWRAAAR